MVCGIIFLYELFLCRNLFWYLVMFLWLVMFRDMKKIVGSLVCESEDYRVSFENVIFEVIISRKKFMFNRFLELERFKVML